MVPRLLHLPIVDEGDAFGLDHLVSLSRQEESQVGDAHRQTVIECSNLFCVDAGWTAHSLRPIGN